MHVCTCQPRIQTTQGQYKARDICLNVRKFNFWHTMQESSAGMHVRMYAKMSNESL